MRHSFFLKLKFVHSLFFISVALFISSCVNDDYNLDNIDKNVVFSPNGLSVPAGSFEPIYLIEAEVSGWENIFIHTISGFFSESFYEYFIIDNNKVEGGEEAIGDISFEANIFFNIKNLDAELVLHTHILDEYGNDIGIVFEPQEYDLRGESSGKYKFSIEKEDILKLKNAYTLRYTIYIDSEDFVLNENDNIVIKDMYFISTGGISFELDF